VIRKSARVQTETFVTAEVYHAGAFVSIHIAEPDAIFSIFRLSGSAMNNNDHQQYYSIVNSLNLLIMDKPNSYAEG